MERVHCVPDAPTHLYSVTRRDFLANDWEVIEPLEDAPEQDDDSTTRFKMMELR
jgi:hypothetical protein